VGESLYQEEESFRDELGEVSACDALLFGRGGYESLFPIFSQRNDPWAARINAMDKYVFSSTLHDTRWQNSKLVRDDAAGAHSTHRDHSVHAIVITRSTAS
jgi:hypothetical protein